MKNGTLYAKRIKKAFTQLKTELGKPEIPEAVDPVRQVILGVLGAETTQAKSARAIKALFSVMVDVNELRVSTTQEIAAVIAPYVSNNKQCADAIRRALNAIYRKEHAITLDHLHKTGRREARHYLESLDGIDACTAASVMLWSLGGHAVPVSDRMCNALRKTNLVNPEATVVEVQAFLERNIAASDGKIFCLLMDHFASSKVAAKLAPPKAAKREKSAKPKAKTTRSTSSKKTTRKPAAKSRKKTAAR